MLEKCLKVKIIFQFGQRVKMMNFNKFKDYFEALNEK